jgi:Utp11 protein
VEEVLFGGKGKSKEARELNARIAREAELDKMERKVVLQMQLMGKGMARRVRRRDEDPDDEESIPVYKWKPQRKR